MTDNSLKLLENPNGFKGGSLPETSILIRAFNEQKHIGKLLRTLREQNYKDYEILLVDSGSIDNTLSIARDYCDQIHHIQSRDFTFGYSLNVGCRHSRGRYIAIVSAHAIPIHGDWLGSLVSHFRDERTAMVYGRHVGAEETKFSEKRDFSRFFGDTPLRRQSPPYYANNANSAIRKSLWEEHPFDEYLTGLEDIAWARHFIEKGYAVDYEPGAPVHHIHEESWHQVYNRYRREALAARRIGLDAPPHSRPGLWDFCRNVVRDSLALPSSGLPALDTLDGILKFRYQQWRGTREGWHHDIDLKRERNDLFFSGANQGVVVSGKQQAALKEMPMPEIKPGDVLIKVAYVGVCHTDLEIYDQELGYYKKGEARYPIVPGHEFCGEIVQVGANGGGFRIGDRVVGECLLPCGACPFCLSHQPSSCERRREVGVVNFDGAYARFLSMPAKSIHKIPDGLATKTACLAEPLAVVRKGLRRIAHRMKESGEPCAVLGAGPIGHLCAKVLAFLGHEVTVFDTNAERLKPLKAVAETSQALEGLSRFSVIVEATGRVEPLKKALQESRADATLLLLGFPYGDLPFNFEQLVAQEKAVVGSVGSAGEDFEWALETLPKLDVSPLTATVLALGEFSRAWEIQRSGKQLKVLLTIWGEEFA